MVKRRFLEILPIQVTEKSPHVVNLLKLDMRILPIMGYAATSHARTMCWFGGETSKAVMTQVRHPGGAR